MYDEDDFENQMENHSKEVNKKLSEIARKDFIEGCYMAYDMLVSQGSRALETGDVNSICKAIDRMMGLFIIKEEYERCQFLANFVKQNIPDHEIVPDSRVTLEFEN